MPDATVRADLDGLASSEAGLLRLLDAGFDPATPSRLPGWTVGHVLTHVARNADAMRRVFAGATAGRVEVMYPDGAAGRAAAIDAGAARTAPALVDDVRTSGAALGTTLASVPDPVWATGRGGTLLGERTLPELVLGRWREVEIHRIDLGFGGGWESWPPEFVARALPPRVAEVNARREAGERFRVVTPDGVIGDGPVEVRAAPARTLAYLIGRTTLSGLPDVTF